MRLGLDTNVLAYAEGVNDAERKAKSRAVMAELTHADVVLPLQVAGELFRVLVRRGVRSPREARDIVLGWQDLFTPQPTTDRVFAAAMDLAVDHRLSIGDAVILSAAAEAGCRLLLSEDFSEGFTWRGLTVVNPFAPARHPLLAAALKG